MTKVGIMKPLCWKRTSRHSPPLSLSLIQPTSQYVFTPLWQHNVVLFRHRQWPLSTQGLPHWLRPLAVATASGDIEGRRAGTASLREACGGSAYRLEQAGEWNVSLCVNKTLRRHIFGLVQEKRNSSALALELCLSCTNPSTWELWPLKLPATQLFSTTCSGQ